MNSALRILFAIMFGSFVSRLIITGFETGDTTAIMAGFGIIAATGLCLSWTWFLHNDGRWP